MPAEIKLGISSCLLGQPVRYDGGHKLDRFLRDTLGRYVRFVPVCPEIECGLPVPREAMHLVGGMDAPRSWVISKSSSARMKTGTAGSRERLSCGPPAADRTHYPDQLYYVRKYDQSYLDRQTYLAPHPIALQLRNHV